MNQIEVSLDEVLRHFLRKQSHKDELRGVDVEHSACPENLIRNVSEYKYLAERILQCNWSFCSIHKDLFESLNAVSSSTWHGLSGGTLKISDISRSITSDKDQERVGKVLTLQRMVNTEKFDWRIIIERVEQDYTVLDGVSRAIAMARYFGENGFKSFYAYIGSPRANTQYGAIKNHSSIPKTS